MKSVKFKGRNRVQSNSIEGETNPLYYYTDGVVTISKWRLSFWERLKVLIFGSIYLHQLCGKYVLPTNLSTKINLPPKIEVDEAGQLKSD